MATGARKKSLLIREINVSSHAVKSPLRYHVLIPQSMEKETGESTDSLRGHLVTNHGFIFLLHPTLSPPLLSSSSPLLPSPLLSPPTLCPLLLPSPLSSYPTLSPPTLPSPPLLSPPTLPYPLLLSSSVCCS